MTKLKRRILITGIGGDIAQGIVRCIKEKYIDTFIVGCDADNVITDEDIIDLKFVVPLSSNEEEYIQSIIKISIQNNITHIFPTTEQEIKVISCNKDVILNSCNVKIIINNEKIIEVFTDKYKTIEFFKNNGIEYPKTYELESYSNQLKMPVIVKGKFSRGSKDVRIVYNEEEIKYLKKFCFNSVVQEYLGDVDNEFTVGVFSDGINVNSIIFKRVLGYGGLSKKVELIKNEEIDKLAIDIAKACNLKGSINIQLRKEKNRYVPFEINPRISSTVYFRKCFGFDDVNWWLDIIDNENLRVNYINKYKSGLGIKILKEIIVNLE